MKKFFATSIRKHKLQDQSILNRTAPGDTRLIDRIKGIGGTSLKSVLSVVACVLPMALGLLSCGNKQEAKEELPANFANLPDTTKVVYMMKHVTADSVARFICDASLGKSEVARIDTLAIAAAYAYEHYNDSCLIIFSREFDEYSSALPLADKMKIYAMAGESDPQRLGYQLGLEYVSHIRESKMNVEQVRQEINAFKNACVDDSLTYIRFLKGFKTVLQTDHGKDLPESIYNEFINY